MTTTDPDAVFDYRALRLLMGLIAFSLPFATRLIAGIANEHLSSISASVYTKAQDVFICMLCIIATLLWAYNGHSTKEKLTSKIASIATLTVVIFPTSRAGSSITITGALHYAGAVVVFGILIYFCLGPFREGTKGHRGKKGIRATIYLVCGVAMAVCMIAAVLSQVLTPADQAGASSVVFWAETVALLSFGIAWIVAGKFIPVLTDEDERLKLSLRP